MNEKLKIRFMTVIWGPRYIEEFSRVSLPSFLAAGNLPAMAQETDLEVVILTSTDSRQIFDNEPIFARLAALCPVRFIYIDDLITAGNYGVTLTLAYARGIRDCGSEQTNTNFVFMNSDFVLADGSLRTLVRELQKGHRCVMAPSLRAGSERTHPLLRQAVEPEFQRLAMAPRHLVRIAFENLHPTVLAKTVTQNLVTCATHNQIYWQVDETALLARYYLIFMLAIRPERPMEQVNCYCDYGFVSELVPSGEFRILDDSDVFFMLELQAERQEQELIRYGSVSQSDIARELSIWCTREHRRFGEVDVLFRTGEIPARLEECRKALGHYVDAIDQCMSPRPRDHADHFYWASGVQAWRNLRERYNGDSAASPPELAVGRTAGSFSRLIYSLYVAVLGYARCTAGVEPVRPIWHFSWLDSHLVLDWLREVNGRTLLICDPSSKLARTLPKMVPMDVVTAIGETAGRANDATSLTMPGARYDEILIQEYGATLQSVQRKIEWALARATPDARVSIYLQQSASRLADGDLSVEFVKHANSILTDKWIGYRITARFVGGNAKRKLQLWETQVLIQLAPAGARHLPWLIGAALAWPLIAALTAINNLRLRERTEQCPPFCSAALMTLRRL